MRERRVFMAMRTSGFLTEYAAYIKGDVLDVGCGRKPYMRLIAEMNPKLETWTGLDARPVGDVHADMDDFALEAQFDTVLCLDALQYSQDPRKALKNMVEHLRPGGYLIVVAPNVVPEDGVSWWRFSVPCLHGLVIEELGLENVVSAGLTGLWDTEALNFENSGHHAITLPKAWRTWVEYLDQSYPCMSALVARKPETEEQDG